MNQSDEIVVLSGEPYLKEDVLLKVDPEEYIWQAELSDWISSQYVLSLTAFKYSRTDLAYIQTFDSKQFNENENYKTS